MRRHSYFGVTLCENWEVQIAKLTLDNTDTETISAFPFRLNDSLVVSVSQDAGGYVISRQNNLKSPYLYVDWVTLHWYACGADGRSVGRESVR